MEKVSKGVYSLVGKEWNNVSSGAKKFIKKLLEYDPNQRYTAEQAVNDPWILEKSTFTEIDKPMTLEILSNLKNFRVFVLFSLNLNFLKATHKLQHAIWIYIVSFLATREEKSELFKTFQALDLNGDGQLTRDELLDGKKVIKFHK